MRTIRLAAAALCVGALFGQTARAQLTPDPTFGTGGVVRTDFGTDYADEPHALLIQSDGMIVTAGVSGDPATFDQYLAISRHSTDGDIDSTFGTAGEVLIHFVLRDIAYGIALQDDGKIVAAGMQMKSTGVSSRRAGIYRFHPNGQLDDSFATAGWDSLQLGPNNLAQFSSVTILPGGRILAAGHRNGSAGFAAVRFTSEGQIDPTYGSSGLALLSADVIFPPGSATFLPDGGILWSHLVFANGWHEFALARVDSNGIPNGALDGDGSMLVGAQGLNNSDPSVAMLPDGKIVLAGSTPKGGGSNAQFTVFRFHEDGSPDSTFGTLGRTDLVFTTGSDVCRDLAVYPDGRILLVGSASEDCGLARLEPDGTPDTTFGPDGKLISNLNGGGSEHLSRVLIRPNGSILGAGYDWAGNPPGDFFLVRYTDAATAAPEIAQGPVRLAWAVSPNPTRGTATIHLALPSAGAVWVDIFDVTGRTVRRLLDRSMPPGQRTLAWDGRDEVGHDVPAGVYFVKLQTSAGAEVKKLTRIR